MINLPEEIIESRLSEIKVFSPDKNYLHLKLREEEIVLDRTKFDRFLADMAKGAGARIKVSHRFLSYDKDKHEAKILDVKNKKEISFYADILIGADGPRSKIRELINKREVKYYVGSQATANIKTDGKTFETYFGKRFPYFFGWVVPVSKESARIGLAAKNRSGLLFEDFIKDKVGYDYRASICENQGGLIPVYDPGLNIIDDRIAIVGDAATQLKATTGGGIVPGMKASEEIVKLLMKRKKNVKNKNLKIHKQLILHLWARKILDTFSDKDYNRLIRICKRKNVKKLLEENSRDYPSKFIYKSITVAPRMFIYSKNVIKALLS
jgi:flavin-dependent dehydrogenase